MQGERNGGRKRVKMIVASLGYGYVSKYLLKKIASDGVKCIGVTDNIKYIKKKI